jgi:hypothetical protein
MALVVDATVGGANSNSYQTTAEITEYFLRRVPLTIADQWNDLDEKDAANVMATMWMEALIHWSHFPTTSTQALSWPQYGQWDRSGSVMIADNVIPRELKNCHAEIALYLAQEDRIADFDPIRLGISLIKAGSLRMDFREKIPTMNQPTMIPSSLFNLLVPSWVSYIEDENSGVRELVRA